MGASERFDRVPGPLVRGTGAFGSSRGTQGLLHGADAAAVAQERGADGRAGRPDARQRPASSAASLRGQGRVVRSRRCCGESASGSCRRWTSAAGGWWIIDDTGFPKKGKHSVGVARQYCGMLGKQDNCQVAVSVSLACDQGSVPVAWQLYLPEDWAADPVRRATGRRARGVALRHQDADRAGAIAHLAGRRSAAPLRVGRRRLWRGHRVSARR